MEEKSELVKRCDECDFCVFEHILHSSQLKLENLSKPFNKGSHAHREIIEQVCGKHNDNPCFIKHVVMRTNHTDYTLAQLGAINNYRWDAGNGHKRNLDFEELSKRWVEKKDYGRGIEESYAQRFREVWDITQRKGDKGILSVLGIYEVVVSEGKEYDYLIRNLTKLKESYEKRDKNGLKIFKE